MRAHREAGADDLNLRWGWPACPFLAVTAVSFFLNLKAKTKNKRESKQFSTRTFSSGASPRRDIGTFVSNMVRRTTGQTDNWTDGAHTHVLCKGASFHQLRRGLCPSKGKTDQASQLALLTVTLPLPCPCAPGLQ